jgi:hypothetical protein
MQQVQTTVANRLLVVNERDESQAGTEQRPRTPINTAARISKPKIDLDRV